MFSSPVVRRRCVGLGVACTFYVFLIGYDVTVVDYYLSHGGVDMSRLICCSEQDFPSSFFCNEAMIDFIEAVFGCSLGVSETFFGCSLACTHAYLVIECSCELLTPFSVAVVNASTT